MLVIAGKVAFVGLGATLILDLWSWFLRAAFGVPFPNYTMVGRWIGYIPQGRFQHDAVAQAPAVAGETAIGWIAHYGIGILYAGLLIALTGAEWLRAPTLLPAMAVGIATVAAPLFIMQPAMGLGIAASRTPQPNAARLRSLAAHSAFGFGLYAAALLVSSL